MITLPRDGGQHAHDVAGGNRTKLLTLFQWLRSHRSAACVYPSATALFRELPTANSSRL